MIRTTNSLTVKIKYLKHSLPLEQKRTRTNSGSLSIYRVECPSLVIRSIVMPPLFLDFHSISAGSSFFKVIYYVVTIYLPYDILMPRLGSVGLLCKLWIINKGIKSLTYIDKYSL